MKKLFGVLTVLCLVNIIHIDETKAQFINTSTTWEKDCIKWHASPIRPESFNTYLSRGSDENELYNRQNKPIFLVLTLDDNIPSQFLKSCHRPKYKNITISAINDSFVSFDDDSKKPIKSNKAQFILNFDDGMYAKTYSKELTEFEPLHISEFIFQSPEIMRQFFIHRELTITAKLKESGMHYFEFDLTGLHFPLIKTENP
ncbi:hypothetical protein COMNV_01242 [Commensalibacter sp. Nvir]|uniref:hypothetical protein n=1 Tax=Commensalibacter sp. Nvir TaxID=3069817 RepID=UPI002D441084|nr:hypothetical protein COMNV_01242 [Commensalibacter sp. Nvir]